MAYFKEVDKKEIDDLVLNDKKLGVVESDFLSVVREFLDSTLTIAELKELKTSQPLQKARNGYYAILRKNGLRNKVTLIVRNGRLFILKKGK